MQAVENKRALRRQKTHNAIEKQKRLANKVGHIQTNQPHRYAKHHALDCGVPGCPMCGNPRKIWKQKTFQEKKFLDGVRHDDSL